MRTDQDYGRYMGHPMDPRTPADEREFDDLSDTEKRERLSDLPTSELIDMLMDHAADSKAWRCRYFALLRGQQ